MGGYMPEMQVDERQVIEALLRDNRCYYELGLTKRHFEDAQHRSVFAAIADMVERGLEANQVTLSDRVRPSILTGYAPSSSANVSYYAERLRERRRAAEVAAVLHDAINLEKSSVEVIDFTMTELLRVNREQESGFVSVGSLALPTLNRIEKAMNDGGARGIESGFSHLDNVTGGFRPTELVIIAARTSIGKTALALNMALAMAKKGRRVGYFSCEMTRDEIMDRLVAALTNLDHQKIRKGLLNTNGDFQRVDDAMRRLYEMPLQICDKQYIPFDELRNMSRAFKQQGGEVLFVDYLTLVKYGDARVPRHERVGQLTVEMKALSREVNMPVIAMSQLNRMAEEGLPSLASLRQSGEIEENADMVLLLHRTRDEEKGTISPEATVVVAKHRGGPTGKVDMRFDAATLQFHEVDRREA